MDNLFFYAAKIGWFIVEPDNLLVAMLFTVGILFLLNKTALAKKLFFLLSMFILIIALFPVGDWLIYPLETRFPANPELPDKVDGIILLGGSFLAENSDYWGKTQTNRYADRIFHFISLINQYPQAKAVFTGGNASLIGSHSTEVRIARKLFSEMGIKEDRIIYEDKARNTYENGKYTHQMINPVQGERWVVVSSAFHLPRAVGVFCALDWSVIPYPADFQTRPDGLLTPSLDLGYHLVQLNEALREWAGLTAYYFTAKTSQWFPDNCL